MLSTSHRRPPVVWVDVPTTWVRIDRRRHGALSAAVLADAADVFPNRPLANCRTYKQRLVPVLQRLGEVDLCPCLSVGGLSLLSEKLVQLLQLVQLRLLAQLLLLV